MKKLLFLAATGVLLLAGCSQEMHEETPAPPRQTERLGIAEDTDSRAAFDEAGRIVWKAGDRINVNGKDYTIAQAEDLSWYVEVESAEAYKAVYPASAYVSAAECALPAAQTYTAGSFDPAAFCAYCEILPGEKLVFKHLGGMLRFTITGTAKISSVILTGHAGEILAGTGTLTTGGDGHKYLNITSGATSVTLNCPDVQLTPAGVDFYMVVPVCAFAQGFDVTINSAADDTVMTQIKTTAATIARAEIERMPALAYVPQIAFSTDGGVSYTGWTLFKNAPPTGFTTLKVKTPPGATGTSALYPNHLAIIKNAMLLEPTAGEGTVDIDLSDAVYGNNIFPNIFDATGFDYRLRSIRLPRNITTFTEPYPSTKRTAGLTGNGGMTTVVLPAGLTSIGTFALGACGRLAKIGYYDATQADGIRWYALPPACIEIKHQALAMDSALRELNIYAPTKVVIDQYAFAQCFQGAQLVITVPQHLLSAYTSDPYWAAYKFTYRGR